MLGRSNIPRYAYWAVGAIVTAVLLGWIVAKQASNPQRSDAARPNLKPTAMEKKEIHLYFGDLQGRFLRAEQQVVDRPADDNLFGRYLVQALIKGPQNGGSRTLPEGARLRSFFVANATAYVDFESKAFEAHPGGVDAELLTIYSIVNTLVVNVEAIRDVKFLIGGHPAATMAGHLDIQHKFVANMMWIR